MAASLLTAWSPPSCGIPQDCQPHSLPHRSSCRNFNSKIDSHSVLTNYGYRFVTPADSSTIRSRRHGRVVEVRAQYGLPRPSHYHARRRRARQVASPTPQQEVEGVSGTGLQHEEVHGLSRSSRLQKHRGATPGCSDRSDAETTFNASARRPQVGARSESQRDASVERSVQRRFAVAGMGDPFLEAVGDGNGGWWDPLGVQTVLRMASMGEGGNGGPQGSEEGTKEASTSTSKSPSGLSSLDAYFEKLNASKANASDTTQASSSSPSASSLESSRTSEGHASALGTASQSASEQGSGPGTTGGTLSPAKPEAAEEDLPKGARALRSLDAYFDKLRPPPPAPKEVPAPPPPPPQSLADASASASSDPAAPPKTQLPELPPELKDNPEFQKIWGELENWAKEASKADPADPSKPVTVEVQTFSLDQPEFVKWVDNQKEASAPWAINLFITLNIAVYILELGSPELVPNNIMTSLPSLYMAKVNQLIVDGEWWRILTPSFLHSGFLHLLISVWTLWSLGPQVEVALGGAGFIGAFLFGGACGNLLSFFANDQISVGGTGPIYALVGAWLVYLLKNREAIGKEWADGEIWKVAILAGLNLALGSPPPIDDWTHVGATFGGAFYALLAAPKVTRVVQKKQGRRTTTIFGQVRPLGEEPEDVIFLSEGPGPKQQVWIYALCTGVLVAIYHFGTVAANGQLGLNAPDLFI